MSVVDVMLNIIKKEVSNVISFLTEPRGLFETIDKMIVDARTELKKLKPTFLRS